MKTNYWQKLLVGMAALSARVAKVFRNLKTDAFPRPEPMQRDTSAEIPAANIHDEINNATNGPERPDEHAYLKHMGSGGVLKEKKTKAKKKSFLKKQSKQGELKKQEASGKSSEDPETALQNRFVTTATGLNTCVIRNCTCTRVGYCSKAFSTSRLAPESHDQIVEKCEEITSLMAAKVKPDHKCLDLISTDLGNNWYGLFMKLGFLEGRIATMEINTRQYGVAEARYRLLLDWVRYADDGTLGCLATQLWEHGDRQLVKQMTKLY